MDRILERYERYSQAERAVIDANVETQGSWCHQYGRMKVRVEALQKSQRHLMGEQLDSLSMKELQQLEQQLETAMKLIRSRKSQLLYESIAELQRKEKALQEQNDILEKQLLENEKAKASMQNALWEQQGQQQTNSSPPPSFMMQDPLPTLNMGTYREKESINEEEGAAQPPAPAGGNTLPPWMLSHVNG